jgi:acyl carrier protein
VPGMSVSIDRGTILKRLRMLAKEGVDVDPEVLTPDALLSDIGIDSFSLIELVFLVEEEFKITIPFEGLEVKTVGDVVDVIEQNVAAAAG